MYGLKIYITPEDIIAKLSDEDKKRFNQCVFTDVTKDIDGITIDCILFEDTDPYVAAKHRQKFFGGDIAVDTIRPRCHKCVYEMGCTNNQDNEHKCPNYKRDATDGGYYG